ncbi:Gfo/Idh/MocA family protein [Curtobacterium sp. RRHDQ10]|uniref:Gfo/Idh/MocA family protein n=1 Tax=Curtobacterium phyllosphaerae TaxID=3413379 RepID=UPI003BF20D99
MPHEPIRVGLIGGGGIAGVHIEGYAQHADLIRVAAVADADAETAARRGGQLDVPFTTDYAEMLATADIDAVDICLPHHLHRDAIVAAARAGKHVLCEKPLCLSPDEARDVQAAVSDAGVTLMCAHNQLFLPAVARAKELIESGVLGTVYEVRTTDSFRNEFDPSNMGWRADAAQSGGGELIDTGYHPSYLLMHLAGGVPVQATAMLSTHRLTFMEGEDSAQALFRFDNGTVGQMVTSWAYDPAHGTERFSVVGELGALTSDGTTLRWDLRDGTSETVVFPEVDTFAAEIGAFGRCLRDGARPIHTEREGIAVLGMILAAYEGARTGTIAPVLQALPVRG